MSTIDIKAIRTERKLTQRELADEIGVDKSTVWRWENGQEPRGAARTLLQRLAGAEKAVEQAEAS